MPTAVPLVPIGCVRRLCSVACEREPRRQREREALHGLREADAPGRAAQLE